MYLRIPTHICFSFFILQILLGSFLGVFFLVFNCSVSAPIPPSPQPWQEERERERQIFSRFSQSINPVYLIHRYMYMCTVRRMYPHLHTRPPRAGAAPACVSQDKGMVFEFFEFFEFSFFKEREKEKLTQTSFTCTTCSSLTENIYIQHLTSRYIWIIPRDQKAIV